MTYMDFGMGVARVRNNCVLGYSIYLETGIKLLMLSVMWIECNFMCQAPNSVSGTWFYINVTFLHFYVWSSLWFYFFIPSPLLEIMFINVSQTFVSRARSIKTCKRGKLMRRLPIQRRASAAPAAPAAQEQWGLRALPQRPCRWQHWGYRREQLWTLQLKCPPRPRQRVRPCHLPKSAKSLLPRMQKLFFPVPVKISFSLPFQPNFARVYICKASLLGGVWKTQKTGLPVSIWPIPFDSHPDVFQWFFENCFFLLLATPAPSLPSFWQVIMLVNHV